MTGWPVERMHAARRAPARFHGVQRPVRDRRTVSGVPVPGTLAGRLPLRRLRARRRLRAADAPRLRVHGLRQAALPARRHPLRADQDRPGALVPGHLPGDLEQGRHRRRRAAAATRVRQLPDRLELAAQAPQGHGPPRPGAARGPGRGRRDLRRWAAAPPAAVATDGWGGCAGLPTKGYAHEPVELGGGDAALRLPGIHLVFGLAKRWLLGTHHGAVSRKHLPAYLDEYVFRFNRRTAKRASHGSARLVEQAVRTRPTTYRAIVAATASA